MIDDEIPYERLVDTWGAAARTGYSYATLKTYIYRGVMPYRRIGRHVLHDIVELDAWIAAKDVKAIKAALRKEGRVA